MSVITGGPDIIRGTDNYGVESLTGTTYDDFFDSAGGEDIIDGGAGYDTLLIFKNSSEFEIHTVDGVTTISGIGYDGDEYWGHEIVTTSVEAITFADQTVSLVTNTPPVFNFMPPGQIDEDVSFSYQLTADDPDINEILTYSIVSGPSWLSVDPNGLLSGTPTNDDVGTHTIAVQVMDLAGATDQKSFSLIINNINDPPVLTQIDDRSVDQDAFFSHQLTANDIDAGDTLTYSGVNLPSWLSISETGLITGTPTDDEIGSHEITVQVADSAGATDQKTFLLTINNTNQPPVFDFIPPSETNEDIPFSFQLTANDPDMGDHLTYSIVSGPSWLSVDQNGLLTGTPTNDDVGSTEISVQVLDDAGAVDQRAFSLIVNNTNDAPVLQIPGDLILTPDVESLNGRSGYTQTYDLLITAIDVDEADDITFSIDFDQTLLNVGKSQGADYLSLSLYTNFRSIGDNEITVHATDSAGATDSETFTVTVNPYDYDPKMYFYESVEVYQDETFSYQIMATSPDFDSGDHLNYSSDNLIFSGVNLPDWLTVSSDGVISGVIGSASDEDSGTHQITLRVENEFGESNEQTVDFIVHEASSDGSVLDEVNSDTYQIFMAAGTDMMADFATAIDHARIGMQSGGLGDGPPWPNSGTAFSIGSVVSGYASSQSYVDAEDEGFDYIHNLSGGLSHLNLLGYNINDENPVGMAFTFHDPNSSTPIHKQHIKGRGMSGDHFMDLFVADKAYQIFDISHFR